MLNGGWPTKIIRLGTVETAWHNQRRSKYCGRKRWVGPAGRLVSSTPLGPGAAGDWDTAILPPIANLRYRRTTTKRRRRRKRSRTMKGSGAKSPPSSTSASLWRGIRICGAAAAPEADAGRGSSPRTAAPEIPGREWRSSSSTLLLLRRRRRRQSLAEREEGAA